MVVGDAAHQRQAQAAARGLLGLRLGAVEAVEDPAALGVRNAGPIVLDHQQRLSAAALQAQVDAATPVLDAVVQQVAQQHGQRLAVAVHQHRIAAFHAQVDAPGLRERGRVDHAVAAQRIQRDRLRRRLRLGTVLPGQREQLLDQMGRAVDALPELLQRLRAGGVVRRAPQRLQLQLQRRQRRAQLMRRVGDEVLLLLEGLPHAVQQAVEFGDQRLDLGGEVLVVDRRQVLRRAARQLLAHPLQRRQRMRDHPPHDQRQHRQHQRRRQHRAPRELPRHALAHRDVLRDLHDLETPLHREDPIALAAQRDIREAQHRALRQPVRAGRAVQRRAVQAPDLHDQVDALLLPQRQRQAGAHAGAQRQRDLLHLVVEDLVGLHQRVAVGAHALDQRAGQHRAQQEQQQPVAQRARQQREPAAPRRVGLQARVHSLGTR